MWMPLTVCWKPRVRVGTWPAATSRCKRHGRHGVRKPGSMRRWCPDAQVTLNDESAIAELSLFDPNNPIDLTQYDGELISKRVTIAATVETPDGQQVERAMVVTLEIVQLAAGPDGVALQGRWIVTGLE